MFARAMEDAGAKVSEIQARLGHASLATTGRYLAALTSSENPYAASLEELYGVS
jgi:integrase